MHEGARDRVEHGGHGQRDRHKAKRLLVSAYCEAVAWWFERECAMRPEDMAEWFMRSLGGATSRADNIWNQRQKP